MGNFFNNGPQILKLIVKVRIYHIQCINKHLEKKNVDLKTGFLRIFSKNKKKNARKVNRNNKEDI